MAKNQMSQPAGVTEVLALVNLLNNPEEVRSQLAKLEAVRNEINEGLEKKETLERLKDLEGKARSALDDAQELLETSRAEAAKTRAQTESDVNQIRSAVAASRDAWTAERTKMSDELTAKLKAVETREREAGAALEKARTQMERADYALAEAMKLKDEYVEKLDALKGIVQGPA